MDNKFGRYNDFNIDTMSVSSVRRTIEWSYENEEILAEWCDIAQCYKWLNMETYKYYNNMTSYLTIPCIIFSTINGSFTYGVINVPIVYQQFILLIIGSISIIIGIITTIKQYYQYAELKETHRILTIGWDKLARSIRIELSKTPLERIDARHYIKFTRIEFDHLMEINDIIPDFIVKKFNEKVNDDNEMNKIKEKTLNKNMLKKPDICDTIISINKTRHVWFPKPLNADEEFNFYKFKKRKNSFTKRSNSSAQEQTMMSEHIDDEQHNNCCINIEPI